MSGATIRSPPIRLKTRRPDRFPRALALDTRAFLKSSQTRIVQVLQNGERCRAGPDGSYCPICPLQSPHRNW